MTLAVPSDVLRQVLATARRSPFYRERLPDSHLASDVETAFRAVPLTTKEDLRHSYPFGLLAVPLSEIASYHESSGTTGEPTASLFTEDDWNDIASRFLRNAVNLRPYDSVLVKTPYSLATTAHQMHRAARLAGAMVIPADNRTSNMSYPKVLRLLRDIPATVAWCLPTEALLWAQMARLEGLDPAQDFPKLRAFLLAGELMTEPKRRRIEKIWSTKVYQDYGSTETGSLAGECVHGRMHLWSDRLFFEILNEQTGAITTSGKGALIVTTLYRQAMPLVRYLIGDLVEISEEACACGAKTGTIKVFGRESSELTQKLEAAVYSLVLERGVLFWRAKAGSEMNPLAVEIEVAPDQEQQAVSELKALLAKDNQTSSALVRAVAPGTIVRHDDLKRETSFSKPRYFFQAHESWEDGLRYANRDH